jgi:rare lipoprotein A
MIAPSIAKSRRNRFASVSRVVLMGVLALSGCTSERSVEPSKGSHKEVGEASWYGPGFHGKETASGETFNQGKMTAAHPTLPMGTQATVTNLENSKKVEVRINDRGPYVGDRVIDLSRAAARKLDMEEDGTTEVKIETKPQSKTSSDDPSSKTK